MVATEMDVAAVASSNENDVTALRMRIELEVVDPEVVVELQRLARGGERERFALQALRIGVLSLRMASGQVDGEAIRVSGEKLVGDVRELLAGAAARMTGEMKATLGSYLDPDSGSFEQRVRSLVAGDGEMARLLEAHLGAESSMLARTLAGSLGEGSELFRRLSPTDSAGVRAQLEALLTQGLGAHRELVTREFSLDHPDSALSRLVARLEGKQGELEGGFRREAGSLLAELSLDQPDSALSRLVTRVEAAQQTLSGELSLDNRDSALSRMALTIRETLDGITAKNDGFHVEMREAIAALRARREEADRSTRHGGVFEEALGQLLARVAQRRGDVCVDTGCTTGSIKNCKVGDHVVELGADSRAAGARIVWEAKEDQSYTVAKARAEMATARGNRDARLGVFVFSKRSAPAGMDPLVRHGDDLMVVWDAEDPDSDRVIELAYLTTVALASTEAVASDEVEAAVDELQRAARAVEKQAGHCDDLRKAADTIQAQAEKINERARKMRAELDRQVEVLDEQIAAFRRSGATA